MNEVELNPDVLEARVRLLASTVDDIAGLKQRVSDEIGHQETSWGELPGPTRMRFAVVQELNDINGSMSILLSQLDELAQSLTESAARIEDVDEEVSTLLASTRSQLEGLDLPRTPAAVEA
ncbi:WXG100 family type VII secretion target [Georgenia sp. Z1344]|uniref:WXG100 family type VII secretion target n=1 Tax=Georgenia sp. Z1344 TaxID=3416706 RepID=UPI003CF56AFA